MNVIGLSLTPGNMLDLNEGREVRTASINVSQVRCYRVRIDGEWRHVHPSDVEVEYTQPQGESPAALISLRPPKDSRP